MRQNNRTFNYFKVKVIYVFISLLEEEKKGEETCALQSR